MTYTKEIIQTNLKTNVSWIIRALEVLFDRQTTDEQETGSTRHNNGRGFNGRDSEILSSFYNQIQNRRKSGNGIGFSPVPLLSDKQIKVCQKLLPKYWKQIYEEIKKRSENE